MSCLNIFDCCCSPPDLALCFRRVRRGWTNRKFIIAWHSHRFAGGGRGRGPCRSPQKAAQEKQQKGANPPERGETPAARVENLLHGFVSAHFGAPYPQKNYHTRNSESSRKQIQYQLLARVKTKKAGSQVHIRRSGGAIFSGDPPEVGALGLSSCESAWL